MDRVFAYQAIAPDGSLTGGTIDADDVAHARSVVASRGMFVVSIAVRGTRRARRDPLSPADLALGLRILGDLLESGLPVGRALHAFHDLAPRSWRRALPHIAQSVREGKSLARALAAAPIDLPPLVIGIAQAGEAGAGIGAAIRRAAELAEATAETRAAIRSALAYPMIVALAGVGAIVVLLTVVLPRFAAILADDGQIYAGCNVENAAYPLGNCAEASAIAAMIAGGGRRITRIFITGPGAAPVTPCGGCRQRIREFAEPETPVICLGVDGGTPLETTLGALLPHSFGPEFLA